VRWREQLMFCGCAAIALSCDANESGATPELDAGVTHSGEEALWMCEAQEPCVESIAQMVDGSIAHVLRLDCAMRELAVRTPGRYRHVTDSAMAGDSTGARHTVVVTDDGSVLYARVPYLAMPGDGIAEPARRCVLRPTSYFEACQSAIESSAGVPFGPEPSEQAWGCAFGRGDARTPSELDWFESCEDLSPFTCR